MFQEFSCVDYFARAVLYIHSDHKTHLVHITSLQPNRCIRTVCLDKILMCVLHIYQWNPRVHIRGLVLFYCSQTPALSPGSFHLVFPPHFGRPTTH